MPANQDNTSVGRGGQNKPENVKIVQALLNAATPRNSSLETDLESRLMQSLYF